jgi:hypothetical protein
VALQNKTQAVTATIVVGHTNMPRKIAAAVKIATKTHAPRKAKPSKS